MAKFTPKKKQNLRRIRRFIKSAEKRGFQFTEELKQNLSSYSTQKLKALTPEKLYKQATYSIGGETVTGTKGRQIERTISAKKGVATKIRKREEREQREWEKAFEDARRHREAEEQRHIEYLREKRRKRESYEEQYIPLFADIVLSNIEQMIEEGLQNDKYVGYKRKVKDNAEILRRYLADEINAYGREAVAKGCENSPDEAKMNAQLALYSSSQETCQAHCLEMVMVIKGNIPTINESKDFTSDV